ncbi:MAG: PfaD family polyunsaturated fatty acid/polyketide biosynthesis protein [Chloroflexi bacterium]|nr:PfaD family polyunsaturated fatty acid/polyketide biosynthesis protein [Chloroflexota bacterium]
MTATVAPPADLSERRSELSGASVLLRHHRILDVQILPGAGFVSLAIGAATAHGGGAWQLQSIRLLRPLPLQPDERAEVCASAERRPDGTLTVRVRSHPAGVDGGWVEHASGIAAPVEPAGRATLDIAAIQARATSVAERAEVYQVYGLSGIMLGPAFQVIERAWIVSQYETIAEVRLGEGAQAALPGHAFNPAMLDGCFQATYGVVLPRILAELPAEGSSPRWTMVPYRIAKLVVHRPLPARVFSHVRLQEQYPTRDLSSVTVADEQGQICLTFELLSVRIALADVLRAAEDASATRRSADEPVAPPAIGPSAPSSMHSSPSDGAPPTLKLAALPPRPALPESLPVSKTPPVAQPPASSAQTSEQLQAVLDDVRAPVLVFRGAAGLRLVSDGNAPSDGGRASDATDELLAWAPALPPERLGHPAFARTHGVRYAYAVGEMANGIASEAMVAAAARARLLAFFGAGGLEPGRVEQAIHRIKELVGPDAPVGFSLLHDVHDLLGSQKVVDLYLQHGIHCVNASAFITLTAPVVQYRVTGLHQRPDGEIVVPNRMFAKISRAEVARRFLEPAPPALVAQLLREGRISEREAELARHISMADDITAEGDSGGHTDRQVLSALLPTIRALRDDVAAQFGYHRPIRVGAAGGLGTPEAVAAAFALGADYVLTGSVNQACVEAGTSGLVREMLAEASSSDVAMAADAGSFEMGSQVQVLRRGTLFAARSQRLLELYRRYGTLADIPERERQQLETTVLRMTLDEIWRSTEEFFSRVDPRQLERAARDEHHKMALVLRWYLGLSSKWAQQGLEDRKVDFQVWCGPAMGAFNTWARGSFLEGLDQRTIVQVAENLMHGAAMLTRRQWLTGQGVPLPAATLNYRPRRFD